MKFKVLFYDYDGDEVEASTKFETMKLAREFVSTCSYSEYNETYEDGDYTFKNEYRYYNPDDMETYFGYDIQPIERKLCWNCKYGNGWECKHKSHCGSDLHLWELKIVEK